MEQKNQKNTGLNLKIMEDLQHKFASDTHTNAKAKRKNKRHHDNNFLFDDEDVEVAIKSKNEMVSQDIPLQAQEQAVVLNIDSSEQQIQQLQPPLQVASCYEEVKCVTEPSHVGTFEPQNDTTEMQHPIVLFEEEEVKIDTPNAQRQEDVQQKLETLVDLSNGDALATTNSDQQLTKKQKKKKQLITTQIEQKLKLESGQKCSNCLLDCNSQILPGFKQCDEQILPNEDKPILCNRCAKFFQDQKVKEEQKVTRDIKIKQRKEQRKIQKEKETIEERCLGICGQVTIIKKSEAKLRSHERYFCDKCKEMIEMQKCLTCKTIFQFPQDQFKNVSKQFEDLQMEFNQFTPNCDECTKQWKNACANKCKQCLTKISDDFNFQIFDGLCWSCVSPTALEDFQERLASYDFHLKSKQQIYLNGDKLVKQEINAFEDVKQKLKMFKIEILNSYPLVYNWYFNLEKELREKESKCKVCKISYSFKPSLKFDEFQMIGFCQLDCLKNHKQKFKDQQSQVQKIPKTNPPIDPQSEQVTPDLNDELTIIEQEQIDTQKDNVSPAKQNNIEEVKQSINPINDNQFPCNSNQPNHHQANYIRPVQNIGNQNILRQNYPQQQPLVNQFPVNQGIPLGMNQGVPLGMNQGIPLGMNQGVPLGMNQGVPLGIMMPNQMPMYRPNTPFQFISPSLNGFSNIQQQMHVNLSNQPIYVNNQLAQIQMQQQQQMQQRVNNNLLNQQVNNQSAIPQVNNQQSKGKKSKKNKKKQSIQIANAKEDDIKQSQNQ
eukprot:403344530